jgi:D-alanyl-lipoteichoic acid acyltransferase DltB (MBOAT superfamily)
VDIVLPLAISFFTFQQIAFLVDCYRGLVARIDPLRYALFVSFFPQLIAGPIVHHGEIFPQLSRSNGLSPSALEYARGVTRFALGLAKKLLLADPLAQVVGPVFGSPPPGLTGLDYSVALLAFSLQIYLDFSAYSDMAIGLGQLFGVKLPENFNSPYKACCITDFWRRWHMTLSRFLRDYLYIPLVGNRRGPGRRWLNLMLTMLLGGLWHGAAWQFVVWGGIHGLLLITHQLWRRFSPQPLPSLPAMALTFFCVSFAWLFFVAPDLNEALRIAGVMLTPQASNWQFSEGFAFVAQLPWFAGLGGMSAEASIVLLTGSLLAAVCLLPNSGEILSANPGVVRWQPKPAWALMLAPLVLASLSLMQGANVFVYFQF